MGGMIQFSSKGNFDKTEKALKKMSSLEIHGQLDNLGRRGVQALSSATPVSSGRAATSWSFEVKKLRGAWAIYWTNDDIENGFPVVIGIQYGHYTGTGGWVQGRDFINPAIRPIFDEIADQVWKVVTSA